MKDEKLSPQVQRNSLNTHTHTHTFAHRHCLIKSPSTTLVSKAIVQQITLRGLAL